MYGGRVTDDNDRRVLTTYLDEYMGEFIFDKNQEFFFSRESYDFKIPHSDMEQTQLAISQIPLITVPGVFGLHSNAEIQYYNNSARSLWLWMLEMQSSEGSADGASNRDQHIIQIIDGIESKLPVEFDIPLLKKQFEEPSPTQVVLLQEIERFNALIEGMKENLFSLKRALNGEIGMSAELELMANQFFNGLVPSPWLKLAPQTMKNLVNWIEHFERRNRQYKDWADKEEPKVMWLSGLHIPESYLTALVQTTCRAKGWPLDKSLFSTEVTKERDPNNIKQRLAHGTYIQGLYLEGARWNTELNCLDVQLPKELVVEMPLVQIIPIEANRLKLRGTLRTPVYVTQNRRDSMGVGQVFEADLRTLRHPSHWILQGVALVLNTD
jgi:dynein heavy chain